MAYLMQCIFASIAYIIHTVFPHIVSAETILFLNLTLCTVTFGYSTYRYVQQLFAEIRYLWLSILIQNYE